MNDLDELPTGVTPAKGPEPVSALWTTHSTWNVTSPEHCTAIRAVAEPHMLKRGAMRSDYLHMPDLVTCHKVLGQDVVSPIINALDASNDRWWRLDLDVMDTQMKVLRYRPGHYAPAHVDLYPGSTRRKLSMVLQLSAPRDHDGGDLLLQDNACKWWPIERGLGHATVFPAWTPHRVTPVITGERWTLAVWGYGPPVR